MNINIFGGGIVLTIIFVLLIRNQSFVDGNQWLRRMIGHHSTALTTSLQINKRTRDKDVKQLSNDIIIAQEKEITQMKRLLG